MISPELQAAIDVVQAKMSANDTVVGAATVYIKSVPGLIAAAVAAAEAQGAAPELLAIFSGLGDQLTAADAPLQAALTVNTPDAPPAAAPQAP